jgi:hypothetical protein
MFMTQNRMHTVKMLHLWSCTVTSFTVYLNVLILCFYIIVMVLMPFNKLIMKIWDKTKPNPGVPFFSIQHWKLTNISKSYSRKKFEVFGWNIGEHVRFGVLTAATVKAAVFCCLSPHNLVCRYQHLEELVDFIFMVEVCGR